MARLFALPSYFKPKPKPDDYAKYEGGATAAVLGWRTRTRTLDVTAGDRNGGGGEVGVEGSGPAEGLDLYLHDILDDKVQVWQGALCVLGYMAVGVVAYSFGLEGWG